MKPTFFSYNHYPSETTICLRWRVHRSADHDQRSQLPQTSEN
jgi:hypothetical protein